MTDFNLLAVAPQAMPPEALAQHDEKAVVDLLRRMSQVERLDPYTIELLGHVLVRTDSDAIRDAVALALADLKATSQIPALIDVIGRPEMAKRCGTLIFALDELGGSIPLGVLVQVSAFGSYEARAEALLIAQDGRIEMPTRPGEIERLTEALRLISLSKDEEASDVAGLLLDEVAKASG